MKIKFAAMFTGVAFILGLLTPPAYAARAVSGWVKVFGHSTSCTLVRASVNSENQKGGAQIHNFVGCNAANSSRAVPPGYLAARALLFRSSTRVVCGTTLPWAYNPTTTDDMKVTSNPRVNSSYCPATAAYQGVGYGRRWSEGNMRYEPADFVAAESPAVNF